MFDLNSLPGPAWCAQEEEGGEEEGKDSNKHPVVYIRVDPAQVCGVCDGVMCGNVS